MNIHIFGLGAIGSNLMVQLSKIYPDFKYYGYDFDKIEDRNIKTQAYFLEHVGIAKVMALPIILQRYNRSITYFPQPKKVVTKPIFTNEGEDLVIDCFDNAESRRLLKDLGVPTLHIGFSPQYTSEIIWDKQYNITGDVPADSDICSMTEAVPFIHFVVNFALLNLCKFVDSGTQDNYIVTNKTNITKL